MQHTGAPRAGSVRGGGLPRRKSSAIKEGAGILASILFVLIYLCFVFIFYNVKKFTVL